MLTATWSKLSSSPSKNWTDCAKTANGYLFFIENTITQASNSIYRSKDGGATWQQLPWTVGYAWTHILADGNNVYICSSKSTNIYTHGYIYVSIDGGDNWIRTPAPQAYWALITKSGDYLYAASVGGRIYRTNTWEGWEICPNSPEGYWTCCTVSSSGDIYFGIGTGNIWKGVSNGSSWTELVSAGFRPWNSGITDDAGNVYFCVNSVSEGYVYKSADAGATWVRLTALPSENWKTAVRLGSGIAFFSRLTVYYTTDGGASFESVTSPTDVSHRVAVARDSSSVFMGMDSMEIHTITLGLGFSGVFPSKSGVWRNASEVHVAKDGVWRKVNRIFVPVSGAWREVL